MTILKVCFSLQPSSEGKSCWMNVIHSQCKLVLAITTIKRGREMLWYCLWLSQRPWVVRLLESVSEVLSKYLLADCNVIKWLLSPEDILKMQSIIQRQLTVFEDSGTYRICHRSISEVGSFAGTYGMWLVHKVDQINKKQQTQHCATKQYCVNLKQVKTFSF
jgi:hypothetical protein